VSAVGSGKERRFRGFKSPGMKKLKGWFTILPAVCVALHLASCDPHYYAPTGHNVPLFREKHEVHLNTALITTDAASGIEGQAAFSVTRNLGIIANGAYLSAEDDGYGHLAEIGGGYYKPINEMVSFEAFAGGGLGKVTNISQNDYTDHLKFSKFFVQPNFGVKILVVEIAISPKLAIIHFEHGFTETYQSDANGQYYLSYSGKKNYLALEPAFTLMVGWKYVKLQGQAIYSFHSIPNGNEYSFSLGLHLMLAPRFRKASN
jgi:hypothetical protein